MDKPKSTSFLPTIGIVAGFFELIWFTFMGLMEGELLSGIFVGLFYGCLFALFALILELLYRRKQRDE